MISCIAMKVLLNIPDNYVVDVSWKMDGMHGYPHMKVPITLTCLVAIYIYTRLKKHLKM